MAILCHAYIDKYFITEFTGFLIFCFFQAKVEATVNMTPSRVIHLRGIPQDTTEGEIVQLGMPFGRMTNLLLVKKKNQVRTDTTLPSSSSNLTQLMRESARSRFANFNLFIAKKY